MGIFNSAIFNNLVFNTSTDTPPVDTHDGADYIRYRKRLEKAAKAAEEHLQSKYVKHAIKVAEIVEDLPVNAPEIAKVAEAINDKIKLPEIDYMVIQSELLNAIRVLDAIILEHMKRSQESDDEIAFLLMVN